MRVLGLDNVKEAGERLPPGGYVCRIENVEDFPEKEYVKVSYDIFEGEYKDYYKAVWQAYKFWGGTFIRSYKEKALPFYKVMITAVEKSNNGFKYIDGQEQCLKGKLIGLVLGEEEYISSDGEIKTRIYVNQIRSVDYIRAGEFTVPPLKELLREKNSTAKTQNSSGNDLPFYSSGTIEKEDTPF